MRYSASNFREQTSEVRGANREVSGRYRKRERESTAEENAASIRRNLDSLRVQLALAREESGNARLVETLEARVAWVESCLLRALERVAAEAASRPVLPVVTAPADFDPCCDEPFYTHD